MTETIHATEHLTPETLCAFIDRELDAWGHRTIQQHLMYCHSCTLRALSATLPKTAIRQVGVRFNPYAFDSSDWNRIPQKDLVRSDNQATVIAAFKQIRASFPRTIAPLRRGRGQISRYCRNPRESRRNGDVARETVSQILQLQFGELQ